MTAWTVHRAGEGVDCKVAMFLNGVADKITPSTRPADSCVTLNRRVFPTALRSFPGL